MSFPCLKLFRVSLCQHDEIQNRYYDIPILYYPATSLLLKLQSSHAASPQTCCYMYMSLPIILTYARAYLLSLSYCYLSFKAHLRYHLLQETSSNQPWPPVRVRCLLYTYLINVEINWTNSTTIKTNIEEILIFVKYNLRCILICMCL